MRELAAEMHSLSLTMAKSDILHKRLMRRAKYSIYRTFVKTDTRPS